MQRDFFSSEYGKKVCQLIGIRSANNDDCYNDLSSANQVDNLLGTLGMLMDTQSPATSEIIRGIYLEISRILASSNLALFGPQGCGKTSLVGTILMLLLTITKNGDPRRTAAELEMACLKTSKFWSTSDPLAIMLFNNGENGDGDEDAAWEPDGNFRTFASEKHWGIIKSISGLEYDVTFKDGTTERFHHNSIFQEGDRVREIGEQLYVVRSGYNLVSLGEREDDVFYGILGPWIQSVKDGSLRAGGISTCGFINNISGNASTTQRELRSICSDLPGLCFTIIPKPEGLVDLLLVLKRKKQLTPEEQTALSESTQLYNYLKGNFRDYEADVDIITLEEEQHKPLDALIHPSLVNFLKWGTVHTIVLSPESSISSVTAQVAWVQEYAVYLESNPACRNVVHSEPSLSVPKGTILSDTAGVDFRPQHEVRLNQVSLNY